MTEQKETKVEGKNVRPEKVKAKVIQIATSTTNTGQVMLVVLMDDGTMHRRVANSDSATWVQIPSV